jgi:hypothetical protein
LFIPDPDPYFLPIPDPGSATYPLTKEHIRKYNKVLNGDHYITLDNKILFTRPQSLPSQNYGAGTMEE